MNFTLSNIVKREVPVLVPTGDKNAYKKQNLPVEFILLNEDEWYAYLEEMEELKDDRRGSRERDKAFLEEIFVGPLCSITVDGIDLEGEDAKNAILQNPLTSKAITAEYISMMNKNNFRLPKQPS